MKRLLTIKDADVGLETKGCSNYRKRGAARAVLKKGNEIALLHVKNHNYYKLPGGGIDDGETIIEALNREILEETGCTSRISQELGEIFEERSHVGVYQTSYCFIAEVIEEGTPKFTEKELGDGFELVWVFLDKAINLIKNSKPNS